MTGVDGCKHLPIRTIGSPWPHDTPCTIHVFDSRPLIGPARVMRGRVMITDRCLTKASAAHNAVIIHLVNE